VSIVTDDQKLRAVLLAADLGLPIAWPNEAFRAPAKLEEDDAAYPAAWLSVVTEWDEPELWDARGGEARKGRFGVGVWVQRGAGDERSMQIVAALREAVVLSDGDGVVFFPARPERAGEVEYDAQLWSVWNVWWPFLAQG